MQTRILFLYTEIADYFLACVSALMQAYPVEVHLVRWPLNKEAPFQFAIPESIVVYEKEEFSREELLVLSQRINPQLIFCSGWIDKDYLAVVRSFEKRIPTVVGMDNQWKGSLKQQVARLLAPFTLQRMFTHAFVAGSPQQQYALKLGFKEQRILQGYYSADVAHFQKAYLETKIQKKQQFPRKLLYVGRYIPHKGLKDLWQAFIAIQEEQPNEWELWCLGTGPLEEEAIQHPKIKHFGFVQPKEMHAYISQTGVFVLPSHFEPWGVVVHEFAAAGFPLLCSDTVGASTAFLQDDHNGFSFRAGSVEELKVALHRMMNLPDEELLKMGERSVALALRNTPAIWASKMMGILQENEIA